MPKKMSPAEKRAKFCVWYGDPKTGKGRTLGYFQKLSAARKAATTESINRGAAYLDAKDTHGEWTPMSTFHYGISSNAG